MECAKQASQGTRTPRCGQAAPEVQRQYTLNSELPEPWAHCYSRGSFMIGVLILLALVQAAAQPSCPQVISPVFFRPRAPPVCALAPQQPLPGMTVTAAAGAENAAAKAPPPAAAAAGAQAESDDAAAYAREVAAGMELLRSLLAAQEAGEQPDWEALRGCPGALRAGWRDWRAGCCQRRQTHARPPAAMPSFLSRTMLCSPPFTLSICPLCLLALALQACAWTPPPGGS